MYSADSSECADQFSFDNWKIILKSISTEGCERSTVGTASLIPITPAHGRHRHMLMAWLLANLGKSIKFIHTSINLFVDLSGAGFVSLFAIWCRQFIDFGSIGEISLLYSFHDWGKLIYPAHVLLTLRLCGFWILQSFLSDDATGPCLLLQLK